MNVYEILNKLNSQATRYASPERKGHRFNLRSVWGVVIFWYDGSGETINGFMDDFGNWLPNLDKPFLI